MSAWQARSGYTAGDERKQEQGSFITLPSGKVRWRITDAGGRRPFSGTARNLSEAREGVREIQASARRDGKVKAKKVV